MIHLPFALHDSQQGLNCLVVWRRVLVRRRHNVVNRTFSKSPQDPQQAKFTRRREYRILTPLCFLHYERILRLQNVKGQPFLERRSLQSGTPSSLRAMHLLACGLELKENTPRQRSGPLDASTLNQLRLFEQSQTPKVFERVAFWSEAVNSIPS